MIVTSTPISIVLFGLLDYGPLLGLLCLAAWIGYGYRKQLPLSRRVFVGQLVLIGVLVALLIAHMRILYL